MPDRLIRLGTSPAQRGSATGATCPDLFTDSDRVYAIGRLEDELPEGAPADAAVGPGEVVSSFPLAVLRDAARDLMAQPDLLLAISEGEGWAQRGQGGPS